MLGGYYFGNIPLIKNHFELVMVAIVLISVVPMGIEWLNARRRARLAVVAPSIAGSRAGRNCRPKRGPPWNHPTPDGRAATTGAAGRDSAACPVLNYALAGRRRRRAGEADGLDRRSATNCSFLAEGRLLGSVPESAGLGRADLLAAWRAVHGPDEMSLLAGMVHQRLTTPRLGELISALENGRQTAGLQRRVRLPISARLVAVTIG